MKLCRYDDDRLGLVQDNEVIDVTSAIADAPSVRPWPASPQDWLVANLSRLKPALEAAAKRGTKRSISEIALLSPIANPGKIIAAPVNYRAHQDEAILDHGVGFGAPVKTIEQVGLFLKANSSLVGPSQGVHLHKSPGRHDHEAELVAVIGTRGKDIPESEAFGYVAGYCVGLDMTLRGTEERSMRKSLDSYSVLGPWLTTADEVANPDDVLVHLTVNGQTRQHCSTSHLIFGIAKLIAYASHYYTLYPGDVIMTGTPAGVGPVVAGDVIHVEIGDVGAMTVNVT